MYSEFPSRLPFFHKSLIKSEKLQISAFSWSKTSENNDNAGDLGDYSGE